MCLQHLNQGPQCWQNKQRKKRTQLLFLSENSSKLPSFPCPVSHQPLGVSWIIVSERRRLSQRCSLSGSQFVWHLTFALRAPQGWGLPAPLRIPGPEQRPKTGLCRAKSGSEPRLRLEKWDMLIRSL